MNRDKVIQLGVLAGLVGGWLILRAVKPEWAAVVVRPLGYTVKDFGWWVWAVGGGLLLVLIGVLLWGAYGPRKVHHPEDGMASGCLTMTGWMAGGVLLMLGVAVIFKWFLVSNAISFVMMVLAVWILPAAGWEWRKEWWKKRKQKWKDKHTWVRPEKLAAFLGGKTHIVERSGVEPARRWREWRHYAADGRMMGFEEVEWKPVAIAGTFRWRAGKGGRVIEKEGEGKVLEYVIMVRRDGSVAYFLEEGTGNGVFAFRTVEVREGEPEAVKGV
jgi:hypothetical protein